MLLSVKPGAMPGAGRQTKASGWQRGRQLWGTHCGQRGRLHPQPLPPLLLSRHPNWRCGPLVVVAAGAVPDSGTPGGAEPEAHEAAPEPVPPPPSPSPVSPSLAASSSSAAPAPPPPPPPPAADAASAPSSSSQSSTGSYSSSARRIERLKVALLAALSSLDRGLAANAREAGEVDDLCSRLERLGGPVVLVSEPYGSSAVRQTSSSPASSSSSSLPTSLSSSSTGGGPAVHTPVPGPSLELLAGTWRLVYSSGFNSGSLGGRRPGPPAALFPTILGQVYQRIDPGTAHLDNIVELLLNYGPPDLGLLGPLGLGGLGAQALGRALTGLAKEVEGLPEPLRGPARELLAAAGEVEREGERRQEVGRQRGQERESPAARLTLRHDYEVTSPARVRIVYEETYGELVGSDLFAQLPRLQAPSLPEPLRPPRFLRSATFDVTYLDASLRITRGDRGELRVYLRDTEADATVEGGAALAQAADYDD